jgi:large subunit ribosomal protein L30
VAGIIQIKQTRSANGIKPNQRATLAALGLGRPGTSVERDDSPQLRGQLRVVEHLVSVDEGGK